MQTPITHTHLNFPRAKSSILSLKPLILLDVAITTLNKTLIIIAIRERYMCLFTFEQGICILSN